MLAVHEPIGNARSVEKDVLSLIGFALRQSSVVSVILQCGDGNATQTRMWGVEELKYEEKVLIFYNTFAGVSYPLTKFDGYNSLKVGGNLVLKSTVVLLSLSTSFT